MPPLIQGLSRSMSTSMSCYTCKQQTNVHWLIRVYGKSWNDRDNAPKKVCGACLVGYHIPVLRNRTRKWEFGTVLSHGGSSQRIDLHEHQYLLEFTDDKKEWVSVLADPFRAYTRHFDRLRALRAVRARQRQNPPVRPANPLVSPNRSVRRRRRKDSSSSENAGERSSIEDLTSSSSSEDLFFSKSLFEERKHEDPPKKKARLTFSNNPGLRSLGNRKPSSWKSDGLSTPARSRTSSLSTLSPTSLSSSSSRNDSASSTTSSQRIPRLWTPKEDESLLNAIAQNNNQLCWPKIAEDIPDRTGKQCRERYLNHLGPHLKHSGWSALEDATIFRLYALHGSKWSKIVKALPGRTDNGIKNRFHHLRKRFEKRMRSIPYSKTLGQSIEQIGKCSSFQSLSPDTFVIREIATRLLNESLSVPTLSVSTKTKGCYAGDGEYKFGPFDQAKKSVGCARCGLIVPSKETGTTVCRQTGWCETCTDASLAVSGDLLRVIHLVKEDMKVNARNERMKKLRNRKNTTAHSV